MLCVLETTVRDGCFEHTKHVFKLSDGEDDTVELKWLIHLGWLDLSSWSLQVILCIIHPGWLELPLARTILHGPKPVRATELLL